jgi:hypothetical protein
MDLDNPYRSRSGALFIVATLVRRKSRMNSQG